MEKRGLLPSIKIPGGQRRFSKEIIEKYVEESKIIEASQNPSKFTKNNSQFSEVKTEAGKKFFIQIYKKAIALKDEKMIAFCKAIFDEYDKYKINGHIKRPNGK